jgi:DNA polymerase elongation subunit (family B)
MIHYLNESDILFLDIETVPQWPKYNEVPERFQKLWDRKAAFLAKNEETPSELYNRAGIYAEFGKIICISVGFFNSGQLRIKSFWGDDEHRLLMDFAKLLNNFYNENHHLLCGHNAKEFDFPYIARRMLINHIEIPKILNLAGKKPWEIQHIDTMELWKFGDFKNYTSLDLLTAVFDIPTPKDDISGADVWKVYWEENNLERIKDYCEKDVVALVQLFRSYRNDVLIDESDITIV